MLLIILFIFFPYNNCQTCKRNELFIKMHWKNWQRMTNLLKFWVKIEMDKFACMDLVFAQLLSREINQLTKKIKTRTSQVEILTTALLNNKSNDIAISSKAIFLPCLFWIDEAMQSCIWRVLFVCLFYLDINRSQV